MESWAGAIIAFVLVLAVSERSWASELRPVYPSQHPYLKITQDEIERALARVAAEPWARDALEGTLRRADVILEDPPEVPEGVSSEHRRVARSVEDVAEAYALTGEGKYLEYVKSMLVHYAEVYPTFPLVSRGRSRLTAASSLYETGWYIPLVHGYDLVYEALSGAERRSVEAGILRPGLDCFIVRDYDSDPRSLDWHYRCYNFQAWHLAAVGMAGLVLQDQDLVDYALDSQFGYRHLIGHDVRDDGLFWERSLGYHAFTLQALVHLTEAAWRCGMDLYTLECPDTIGPSHSERELNYPVDGDNGPKTIKMMFDAPFYYPFPDGSLAQVADSGTREWRGRPMYRTAYARYHDPRYAWLVQTAGYSPGLEGLIHGLPEGEFSTPVLGTGSFCNTGRTELGCTLYPATGYAILRGVEQDPRATCVLLNCGPYGGGHGHPDHLNIVLYAHGKQWVPDFGSFSYDNTEYKREWTAQTVSHSTLVVDGISHRPQEGGTSMWPTDNMATRTDGELLAFRADPLMKVARAENERAVDGVAMARTVVLFDGLVMDLLHARGDEEHLYDWVLHVDGEAGPTTVPMGVQEGALGDRCGYQHIQCRGRGRTDGAWGASWSDAEGRELEVRVVGGTDTEVIRGRSIRHREDEHVSTLVARRRSAETIFATLFEPHRGVARVVGVEALEAAGGRAPSPGEAYGVAVSAADGTHYRLLVTDGARRYTFGDLVFEGQLALVKESAGGCEMSLLGARYLAVGEAVHTFGVCTDAFLR